MTKRRIILWMAAFALCHMGLNAQIDVLRAKIEHSIKEKKATVGVSIIANHLKDTLNLNEDFSLPHAKRF